MHNGTTWRRRKRERTEEIFEGIMAENFLKLMIDTKLQIQEAERTPSRINIYSYAYHFEGTENRTQRVNLKSQDIKQKRQNKKHTLPI